MCRKVHDHMSSITGKLRQACYANSQRHGQRSSHVSFRFVRFVSNGKISPCGCPTRKSFRFVCAFVVQVCFRVVLTFVWSLTLTITLSKHILLNEALNVQANWRPKFVSTCICPQKVFAGGVLSTCVYKSKSPPYIQRGPSAVGNSPRQQCVVH